MKAKYIFYALIYTLIISTCLVFFKSPKEVLAQNSPDAISIRVIQNPKHYSSLRWYTEQGFIGTPQQLLIDGYEAVRNGNTVYVNASNISSAPPQTLFTNIYIISYNISADKDTEDIFALILENWKFNHNISNITGFCSPDFSTIVCISDNDCPEKTYCSSDKAETIRDTTRLANIAEFNIALNAYKEKNGHYPKLSAGSYLPNTAISTWPSWQGNLSRELGIQLPLDPINNLGNCSGYNNNTCWNEATKKFADSDLSDPTLNLPANSKAFVYQTIPDGSSYTVCGEMESGFVFGASNGACSNVNNTGGQAGTVINYPPQIIGTNIPVGYSGHPYLAYIQGIDPNNDVISWNLDTSMTTWTNWSGAPLLKFTVVNSQIMIEATTAGDAGTYDLSITLNDNLGGITTRNFSITVVKFPPIINVIPLTYIASSTNPFKGSFTVQGDVFNYPLSYSLGTSFPANFSETFVQNANIYDFAISGTLNPATNILPDGITPYVHNLLVTDSYGTTNNENIVINVINHKPVITSPLACQNSVRVNTTSCSLPWGGTIVDGSSVMAYQAESVFCGNSCLSQTRNCNAGILSGSYTNPSCSVGACVSSCTLPWGGSIADGNSVQAYQDLTIMCGGGSCVSETRTCNFGVLSGSYTNGVCMDSMCTAPLETCSSGTCACTFSTYEQYDIFTECSWTDPSIHCISPGQSINSAYCTSPTLKIVECDNVGGFNATPGVCCESTATSTPGLCDGDSINIGNDQDPRNGGYLAMVSSENLNCTDTSTAANWFKTIADRCGEPSGIAFWNTQISLGSSTSDFLNLYDSNCLSNSGTTNRAICNQELMCAPGDFYIINSKYCNN